MLITFTYNSDGLLHIQPQQYGMVVAHFAKSDKFHSCHVTKQWIQVSFDLESVQPKARELFESEISALLALEPYPCGCGCGQFLAVGPCLVQSGELKTGFYLNEQEKELARRGDKIEAIKAIRERYGRDGDLQSGYPGGKYRVGLKEGKDLVDAYMASVPRLHDPAAPF